MVLHEESCTPCRGGTAPLSESEIQPLLAELPNWSLVVDQGIHQLERIHACRDFATALHLANCIGALAEAENHHPALTVEWGRLTIRYWTHAIGGLHRNDFILAAKAERILTAT